MMNTGGYENEATIMLILVLDAESGLSVSTLISSSFTARHPNKP